MGIVSRWIHQVNTDIRRSKLLRRKIVNQKTSKTATWKINPVQEKSTLPLLNDRWQPYPSSSPVSLGKWSLLISSLLTSWSLSKLLCLKYWVCLPELFRSCLLCLFADVRRPITKMTYEGGKKGLRIPLNMCSVGT